MRLPADASPLVIEALSEAGVPTGVLVAPVIPGLTDFEALGLVHA